MLAPQGTRAKTWAIDVINAGNGGEVRNGLTSSRERAAHVVAKPGHTNHLQPFL